MSYLLIAITEFAFDLYNYFKSTWNSYEPFQLRPDRNILHLSAFQLTDSGVLIISHGVSSNREMLCWPGLSLIMSVDVVLGSAEHCEERR